MENCPFFKFSSAFFIFSSPRSSAAFSTSETISPIPRILFAILSGWKTSKFSIFSPTPKNLIGTWDTNFILTAAPPLASPSALVKTIPVKFTVFLNSFATSAATCPVRESATKNVSVGFIMLSICFISLIIWRSIWVLPAVSNNIISAPLRFAALTALLHMSAGSCPSIIGKVKILFCSPRNLNCSWAAGLYTSRLTIIIFFFLFFSKYFANLAVVVVLPEPWRPTNIIGTGGTAFKFTSVLFSPKKLTSSS